MKHHTASAAQLDQARGRRIAVVVAGMAGLGMLISSPAAASIIDPGPLCSGFSVGLPDGCWEPPQSIEDDEPSVLGVKITRVPPNVI